MAKLEIDDELVKAIEEIVPPKSGISWHAWVAHVTRGTVAEFWIKASPRSVAPSDFRERVRGFLREGDIMSDALRKAQEAYKAEGRE